jgi:hypothetical protein
MKSPEIEPQRRKGRQVLRMESGASGSSGLFRRQELFGDALEMFYRFKT